jgi:hypothetical protein
MNAVPAIRGRRSPHRRGDARWALLVLLPLLAPALLEAAVDFTIAGTPLAYTGGTGARPVDAAATASGDDFTNAQLQVAIDPAEVVVSEDILQVQTRSPILLATNGSISVGGVVIGSYAGGTAGAALVVTMSGAITPAQVTELLRSIAYLDLAGPTPTVGDRHVTLTMTKAGATTVVQARTVHVDAGNALPGVTTNPGLSVGRSRIVDLSGLLVTSDTNDGPGALTYALTVPPIQGNVIRKSTTAGVSPAVIGANGSFTQLEIDSGLIAYEHLGGISASDVFTVVVADPHGATTPATDVAVAITGSVADPQLTLPGPLRAYVEGDPATALADLVDLSAASPVLAAAIADADSPHYRGATLEVQFLTAGDADDGRPGDQLGVSSTPGVVEDGAFVVSGNAISYHWAGADRPFGTIDAQFTGASGVKLRIDLLDSILQGGAGGTPPYLISELITPAVVARFIPRITFRSTDDNPSSAPRLLRFTLRERAPNPGVGSASVALAIQPVNDGPTFTIPSSSVLNLSAVSGIALDDSVLAVDPDSPAPTYALVSKSVPDTDATVTLDAASGAFTFFPVAPFTGPATLVISATDDQGLSSEVTVSIATLPAPSATNRPYVISDPPLEIEEGGSLFHNLAIMADPNGGALTSATLAFIGHYPAGLSGTQLGGNASIWTLTTGPLVRPASGVYSFGVLFTIGTATSGSWTGYQPITLRVRALNASN